MNADIERCRRTITRVADELTDHHDGWLEAHGLESDRQQWQRRLRLTEAQFNGLMAGTHRVVRKSKRKS